MVKNQEERSLLAEQREQEKDQMLEYMEKLQEEDLRVTRWTDGAKFHQQQQQSSPRFGGVRVWTDFLSGTCLFCNTIAISFYGHVERSFGCGAILGDEQGLGQILSLPPGDLGSETNASMGMDTERKCTAICIAHINIGMFNSLPAAI